MQLNTVEVKNLVAMLFKMQKESLSNIIVNSITYNIDDLLIYIILRVNIVLKLECRKTRPGLGMHSRKVWQQKGEF